MTKLFRKVQVIFWLHSQYITTRPSFLLPDGDALIPNYQYIPLYDNFPHYERKIIYDYWTVNQDRVRNVPRDPMHELHVSDKKIRMSIKCDHQASSILPYKDTISAEVASKYVKKESKISTTPQLKCLWSLHFHSWYTVSEFSMKSFNHNAWL